jgi:hypothetical protein
VSFVGRVGSVALIVLALGACSQAQKNAFVHIGQPSVPKSTLDSITLARRGCHWGCPSYTLRFSRGDVATYEGYGHVDKIGKYSGYVDFDLVAAWLDSQDVDAYAGRYGTLVSDSDYLTVTLSRSDQVIVIDSHDTGSLPVRVQGAIEAIDGFGDGVRWKPSGAIESYLGYFLNENTPNELLAVQVSPGDTGSDGFGIEQAIHVGKCAADAFASEQFRFRVRLVGSHAVGTGKSYSDDAGDFGPESPIAVASEPGGLNIGVGLKKRFYYRVTSRAYQSAYDRLYKGFRAVCPSTEPKQASQ